MLFPPKGSRRQRSSYKMQPKLHMSVFELSEKVTKAINLNMKKMQTPSNIRLWIRRRGVVCACVCSGGYVCKYWSNLYFFPSIISGLICDHKQKQRFNLESAIKGIKDVRSMAFQFVWTRAPGCFAIPEKHRSHPIWQGHLKSGRYSSKRLNMINGSQKQKFNRSPYLRL